MRRLLLAVAAVPMMLAAGFGGPANAMPLAGPAPAAVAAGLLQPVDYHCRPVWRCGYWGCGWRRTCWWRGDRDDYRFHWRDRDDWRGRYHDDRRYPHRW